MVDEPASITCPRCQKKFKGKPELYGKRIRCPACQKPFVVPSPEAKIDEEGLKDVISFADEEEVKEAIKVPTAKRYFEEDEGPANYDVTVEDMTPRCPNCANPLENADAVVCLYCGYNTSTRTWGRTEKVIETTGGDRFMWLLPGLICALVVFLMMIACLFYCLVLPNMLAENWWGWITSEAGKMWFVIFGLACFIWPAGLVAYWRLVVNPTPPEKEKD